MAIDLLGYARLLIELEGPLECRKESYYQSHPWSLEYEIIQREREPESGQLKPLDGSKLAIEEERRVEWKWKTSENIESLFVCHSAIVLNWFTPIYGWRNDSTNGLRLITTELEFLSNSWHGSDQDPAFTEDHQSVSPSNQTEQVNHGVCNLLRGVICIMTDSIVPHLARTNPKMELPPRFRRFNETNLDSLK